MSRCTYLFARPTFWSGAASIMDMRGVLPNYNFSATPDQADALSMFLDWSMVGDNLTYEFSQWLVQQDCETLKLIEEALAEHLSPELQSAAWQLQNS